MVQVDAMVLYLAALPKGMPRRRRGRTAGQRERRLAVTGARADLWVPPSAFSFTIVAGPASPAIREGYVGANIKWTSGPVNYRGPRCLRPQNSKIRWYRDQRTRWTIQKRDAIMSTPPSPEPDLGLLRGGPTASASFNFVIFAGPLGPLVQEGGNWHGEK